MGKGKSLKRACLFAACTTALAISGQALAVPFPETEPNDGKFTANAVGPMVAGDAIVGNSTGTSTVTAGPASADNYLISFPAAAPGIYRNRLVLTSNTLGQTGTIRALSQTAAPPDTLAGAPWDGVVGTANANTDIALQTSSTVTTPPRYNQFYTFGQPTQMYYRVTGVASTTADYNATLETAPVVPVNIGAFLPGDISISTFGQGHSNDTDLWVYDSNFNAIAGSGNDDESVLGGTPGTGATLQSWLIRNYAVGTYYLALSNFHLSNSSPSPSDDDFRTGTLMDFAGVLVNSSTTTNLNMAFAVTDSSGIPVAVPNTKLSQYDVNFFQFTVVPEPATMGLLTLAVPMLLRRRK